VEFFVDVQHAVSRAVLGIANLDVVVVPAELFVFLDTGEEFASCPEVGNSSDYLQLEKSLKI